MATEEQRKKGLQKRLKMTTKEIDAAIQRWPKMLSLKEENVLHTADWIQEYLQLKDSTLRKIVLKCPSIRGCNVNTLEGKLKYYYQETFGWTIKDLAKVMRAFHIMTLSIEEKIEPKRQWLSTTFNVTNEDISKLIMKNPAIFDASLNDTADRLEFLQDQLELNSTETKWKFLWQAPNVLAFTRDTLNDKLTWFQSSSLGLTKSQTAKVIRKQPTLLSTSIENNLAQLSLWSQ
ncbi:expressed unknown protein [Seminavis robusta]|uniref:Uncharacterized protein n=1 Tax=Seminavis robusta TaxID=568900 RepID=A0A9N8DH08_9STRA|nr:expressed unknown protein [Seminavis robusta]|eukprot:Sro138_g064850.1 n/a (233) ;mRNA; f:87737-88435